jgi:hypothetical protein
MLIDIHRPSQECLDRWNVRSKIKEAIAADSDLDYKQIAKKIRDDIISSGGPYIGIMYIVAMVRNEINGTTPFRYPNMSEE